MQTMTMQSVWGITEMLTKTQDPTEAKLDLLSDLVQERQEFLLQLEVTEDKTGRKFLKRLERRRSVEAQALVGKLMSLTNSDAIRDAVTKGFVRAQ